MTNNQRFEEWAKLGGLVLSKNGWPDYAIWENGKIARVVEVKGANEPIKEHQRTMLWAFEGLAIPAYVWRNGDGLKRIPELANRFGHITPPIIPTL